MKFVYHLDKRYIVPNRDTIKCRIKNEFFVKQVKLKEMLKSANKVSLTCDLWTSCAMEPYLGITCHFVNSENEMVSTLLNVSYFPHPHEAQCIQSEIEEVFLVNLFKFI